MSALRSHSALRARQLTWLRQGLMHSAVRSIAQRPPQICSQRWWVPQEVATIERCPQAAPYARAAAPAGSRGRTPRSTRAARPPAAAAADSHTAPGARAGARARVAGSAPTRPPASGSARRSGPAAAARRARATLASAARRARTLPETAASVQLAARVPAPERQCSTSPCRPSPRRAQMAGCCITGTSTLRPASHTRTHRASLVL